ncbi:MAG: NAD(P)-dependent oxidoreductase [Treponemataceae bacterium]
MKVLMVGDNFFKPEVVIDCFKNVLAENLDMLEFSELKLPYPVDSLYLDDASVIPTGMAWDNNMDADYGKNGVREYYGKDDILNGKLDDVNILIVHGVAVPGYILKQAPALKLIGCLRGGPVNIDMEVAGQKGILVTNTPGKNAQGVAEFTIGLILSHLRNIVSGNRYFIDGRYRPYYYNYDVSGFELERKKIGLVGFGRISRILTNILKAFGSQIYAYDPYVEKDDIEGFGAFPCDFETLISECDIVSVHARAKKSAPAMFGKKEFALMKKTATFVNTARGGLVDYPALYEALIGKKIGGAALDVYGLERFDFYRKLINLPNVTATPHIAGSSRETVLRGSVMMAEEIKRFINSEELLYKIV